MYRRPQKPELLPTNTEEFIGVTEIELNTAVVIVIVAVPDITPEVAVIVAVPIDKPVATPVARMVAVKVLFEDQVTLLVIFKLVPSEYVPVAIKACVRPLGTEAVNGVTAIEFNVVAVTVKAVMPDFPLAVAVIVVVPGDIPVAMPVVAIVAIECFSDAQVTVLLISRLVPSE